MENRATDTTKMGAEKRLEAAERGDLAESARGDAEEVDGGVSRL